MMKQTMKNTKTTRNNNKILVIVPIPTWSQLFSVFLIVSGDEYCVWWRSVLCVPVWLCMCALLVVTLLSLSPDHGYQVSVQWAAIFQQSGFWPLASHVTENPWMEVENQRNKSKGRKEKKGWKDEQGDTSVCIVCGVSGSETRRQVSLRTHTHRQRCTQCVLMSEAEVTLHLQRRVCGRPWKAWPSLGRQSRGQRICVCVCLCVLERRCGYLKSVLVGDQSQHSRVVVLQGCASGAERQRCIFDFILWKYYLYLREG